MQGDRVVLGGVMRGRTAGMDVLREDFRAYDFMIMLRAWMFSGPSEGWRTVWMSCGEID